MNDALLLDTHIALWVASGDARLRPETSARLDACRDGHGAIYFSAVSAWEIALLVDVGRISLSKPVDDWAEEFLTQPGVQAAPLTHSAAARAYRLHHLAHRDPADRLLIATAIELACPLVTYDAHIAAFAARHGGQYGFATEG